MTPGKGQLEGRPFIVGRTAPNYIGASAKAINYGDTIQNPLFIAQMQTSNDNITASLRNYIVSDRMAYVLKQREKSVSQTTPAAETVGWLVMNPLNIIQGVHTPEVNALAIHPNPVIDELYFTQTLPDGTPVTIYDVSGSAIHKELLTNNRINVSHLRPGYYLLRTAGYDTSKFIKL